MVTQEKNVQKRTEYIANASDLIKGTAHQLLSDDNKGQKEEIIDNTVNCINSFYEKSKSNNHLLTKEDMPYINNADNNNAYHTFSQVVKKYKNKGFEDKREYEKTVAAAILQLQALNRKDMLTDEFKKETSIEKKTKLATELNETSKHLKILRKHLEK